jgi:hypothetical protein
MCFNTHCVLTFDRWFDQYSVVDVITVVEVLNRIPVMAPISAPILGDSKMAVLGRKSVLFLPTGKPHLSDTQEQTMLFIPT